MASPTPATTEWVPVWNPATTGPVGPAGPPGPPGAGADLIYSGDYVPATTYNDGDIVVASDGIAYLCVKDGTTTPPEPWPAAALALHHATHEPGGTDPLTALSASILTSGTVPVARLGVGTTTVITNTATGTVNDWAPGLAGNTFIRWTGSANLTITGMAGGTPGQVVTIRNLGSGVIYLPYYDAGSAAANRLVNFATSAPTPLGPLGSATYVYADIGDPRWELIAHEQGTWITPPYSAADYTADGATWTVEASDIGESGYRLDGRTLTLCIYLYATSLSAASSGLHVAIPGGLLSGYKVNYMFMLGWANDQGTTKVVEIWIYPNQSVINVRGLGGATLGPSTNSTSISLALTFPVQ